MLSSRSCAWIFKKLLVVHSTLDHGNQWQIYFVSLSNQPYKFTRNSTQTISWKCSNKYLSLNFMDEWKCTSYKYLSCRDAIYSSGGWMNMHLKPSLIFVLCQQLPPHLSYSKFSTVVCKVPTYTKCNIWIQVSKDNNLCCAQTRNNFFPLILGKNSITMP